MRRRPPTTRLRCRLPSCSRTELASSWTRTSIPVNLRFNRSFVVWFWSLQGWTIGRRCFYPVSSLYCRYSSRCWSALLSGGMRPKKKSKKMAHDISVSRLAWLKYKRRRNRSDSEECVREDSTEVQARPLHSHLLNSDTVMYKRMNQSHFNVDLSRFENIQTE